MRELDYSSLIEKITSWISKYTRNAGAQGAVVGLSGGIDSSVTAVLCAKALGKENVVGLIMPCKSIREDYKDALSIVDKFQLNHYIFDLSYLYKEFLNLIDSQIPESKLARGNVKPRLRMTTLYYVSQSIGNYLVAGTGNKSEMLIGYFTKYGDGGVDFEPIGDLYKYEVKKIAELLEIPQKIIEKPPSAGLWEGQTDEKEIGLDYDTLDEILYSIENHLDLNKFEKQKVTQVEKMIKNSNHKRKTPSIFKVQ